VSSPFVLTIFPDGRAILTTEEELTPETADRVRAAFEQWRSEPKGVAILSGRVEHAESLVIDLPLPRRALDAEMVDPPVAGKA
jgi:hypothetical protein